MQKLAEELKPLRDQLERLDAETYLNLQRVVSDEGARLCEGCV